MSQLTPDFECVGCGHGTWGREPVHCVKCGWTCFRGRTALTKGDIGKVAAALEGLDREAGAIRTALHTLGHRNAGRIQRHLYAIQGRAGMALQELVGVPNPDAMKGEKGMKEP